MNLFNDENSYMGNKTFIFLSNKFKILKLMNIKYLSPIIIILAFILQSKVIFGQLRFPEGTQLNLITDTTYVYFETEIRFYTGKYNMNDYKWIKLNDSINTNWQFFACFNGDCQGGLPDSGNFIKDFGLNDTTGFIRCHIDTRFFEGTSMFQYIVLNKKNWNDQSILTFRVTYKVNLNTYFVKIMNKPILIFDQNSKQLILPEKQNRQSTKLEIYNAQGINILDVNTMSKVVNLSLLQSGIYIIKYCIDETVYIKKIILK